MPKEVLVGTKEPVFLSSVPVSLLPDTPPFTPVLSVSHSSW